MKPRGWEARLGSLVAARLDQPFSWGANDCAAFVADAVAAMHQADTLSELRGPRSNELQAARQVRRVGGIAAALARAGLEPVAPALAATGDVVWLRQGRRRVLAVVSGAYALAPARTGLEPAPLRMAVAAWRT